MLVGHLPFSDHLDRLSVITSNICRGRLSFPCNILDSSLAHSPSQLHLHMLPPSSPTAREMDSYITKQKSTSAAVASSSLSTSSDKSTYFSISNTNITALKKRSNNDILNSSAGLTIALEAKQLILECLQMNQRLRLTVAQMLKHPWMNGG